jgi:tight adherence protein B
MLGLSAVTSRRVSGRRRRQRRVWTVNGARLAVAAPWLVLLLMCFQGDVIERYASTAGVILLAFGAGACLVAYRLMMRIGRLPTEKRILS